LHNAEVQDHQMRSSNALSQVVSFTAIAGHSQWIMHEALWESIGCRFVSSMKDGEGPFLYSPSRYAFPLQRGDDGLKYLEAQVRRPGEVVIGGSKVPGQRIIRILMDDGAATSIAGDGWRTILSLEQGPGTAVRGVGDQVLSSEGRGLLIVTFVSPSHRVDNEVFAALYTPAIPEPAHGEVTHDEMMETPVVDMVLKESLEAAAEAPEENNVGNADVVMTTVAAGMTANEAAEGPSLSLSAGRASRHSPISSCEELRERVGLHRTEVISRAHQLYHGVTKLVAPSGARNALDDAFRLGALRKRRVNRKHSVKPQRRLKKGALFHFDLTPSMVRTWEGYTYAMVCVEDRSRLLFVVPLKDKTAESVVGAIEQLRVFVDSSGGGKKLEELRGDFDCAITVNGRGDDIDTEVLRRYKEQHPIRTKHSPPHTQALNQAEPFMGTLFAQMNVNLARAGLALIEWWDMLSAAADQLNTHPRPGDSSLRSRYQHYWGRKPDLSEWLAFPGQWVYVKVEGAKANRGDQISEPGLYIKPARDSGGSLVRLFRTWKVTHCYGVQASNDHRLRLARLMENDALNRQYADIDVPQTARSEQLRALFRKNPLDMTSDFTLAVVDRYTQLPIKLVPALDDDGHITMLPESSVEDVDGDALDLSARWTALQAFPRLKAMKKPMIASLPLSLPIRFEPTVNRRGQAKARWLKYHKAKTLGHLKALNPRHFTRDFSEDLKLNRLSAKGVHYDSNTSSYSYHPPSTTIPTPIPTASPSPSTPPTPAPTPPNLPTPAPTPPIHPSVPPASRVSMKAADVQSLPTSTPIRFLSYNPKRAGTKSAARWDRYSKAGTVGELQSLNSKKFKDDFIYDLKKCLMFVEGVAYDHVTKSYSLPAASTTSPVMTSTPSLLSNCSVSPVPCVFASPADVPYQEGEDVNEDLLSSSASCLPFNIDLPTALQQDYLSLPDIECSIIPGLSKALKQVEDAAHSQSLSHLEKLSTFDRTLAGVLRLHQLEGTPHPPEVSDASAAHMAMDALEVQDTLEGFTPAVFTSTTVAGSEGSQDAANAFTAKRGDAEHPLLRQALLSEDAAKWEDALEKDVRLMEKHGAIKLVSRSRTLVKRYGKHMVDIKHFVHDCKVKRNAKGEITKYKVRGCVGDATRFGKVDGTYSATVAPSSRKLLGQLLALHPHATSAQNDVQGAYYCGKPTPYEEGGRVLFCHVPAEFERFGYPRYDENGEENLIEIVWVTFLEDKRRAAFGELSTLGS
jgi:hypothetical protein